MLSQAPWLPKVICLGLHEEATNREQGDWWPKSKQSTLLRQERWNTNAKGTQWESHWVTEAESRIIEWGLGMAPWKSIRGSKKVGSEQPVVQCAELSRLPTTGLHPVRSQVAHGKAGLSMDCQNTKDLSGKIYWAKWLISLNDIIILSSKSRVWTRKP